MNTNESNVQEQVAPQPMPRKSKRSQKEIDTAIRRYLAGESVDGLKKEYRISRAGMYNWIRKAKEGVVTEARRKELGPRGIEQETRINKDLLIKNLQEENAQLKEQLFRLMNKYKLFPKIGE